MIINNEIVDLIRLSNLNIEYNELEKYIFELEQIKSFADKVKSFDCILSENDSNFIDFNNLREDIIKESFPKVDILKNSVKKDSNYFITKSLFTMSGDAE